MTTVLVSVAPSQSANQLLGTEEPFGDTRTASVDHDAALVAIVYMISMRANVGVKVMELTAEKVVLSYEYEISHMFKTIPANDMEYYGWLYTIEKDPNDKQGSGVYALIQTVYALCKTYRDICSPQVALWVAEEDDATKHWERENLRVALEYYSRSPVWRGNQLDEQYCQEIFNTQPWRVAYDALHNRPVAPLAEVVRKMIEEKQRRNEALPLFLA